MTERHDKLMIALFLLCGQVVPNVQTKWSSGLQVKLPVIFSGFTGFGRPTVVLIDSNHSEVFNRVVGHVEMSGYGLLKFLGLDSRSVSCHSLPQGVL